MTGAGVEARAVVLVEGMSDRAALEALAARRGRDLAADGVAVVSIGGVTNIGGFLEALGPRGAGVRLAGLCDEGEEGHVRRCLRRSGLTPGPASDPGPGFGRAGMEALGFYVCVADLEDELIRSLGVATVEAVIEAEGELGSFRVMQKQVAQQGRTTEQQLRRFMGTRSGRKVRYARLLVDALDLTRVPRPLDGVLASCAGDATG